MKKWNLRLNLFDGEEGASAPAGGEASVTGVATGTEVGAEGTDTADTTQTGDTDRPSFKDLISGDYKKEADEYIQGIIRKRVRDSKQDKETIAKQAEILNTVAAKYGMDASDLAALQEKVSADDAYIEEAAMEEGLTTDQYRRIRDAEAKAAAYEAHMAEAERERATQQKVAEWQAEAEQVKQVYPDFDLATELENPTFQKQLRLGIDMQSAYVALHQAEILQGDAPVLRHVPEPGDAGLGLVGEARRHPGGMEDVGDAVPVRMPMVGGIGDGHGFSRHRGEQQGDLLRSF